MRFGFKSIFKIVFESLDRASKFKSFYIILLTLFCGVLELLVITMIVPFIAVFTQGESSAKSGIVTNLLEVLGVGERNYIEAVSLILFAAVIMSGLARLNLLWSQSIFVHKIGHELGVNALKQSLSQDYEWYSGKNSSELIATLQNILLIIGGFITPVIQFISALVISIFIIVGVVLANAEIAVILSGVLIASYLVIGLLYSNGIKGISLTIKKTQPLRIQCIQEALGGIQDILLTGIRSFYLDKYIFYDKKFMGARALHIFLGRSPRYIIETIGIAALVLIVFFTKGQEGASYIIPTIGAIAIGAQKLLPLIQQIYASWSSIKGSYDVMNQLIGLISLNNNMDKKSQSKIELKNNIFLDKVSFSYGKSNHMILNEFSFQIKKGERIGIVGKTGSGKSTLINVLMGLLTPKKGEFYVDNKLIDDSLKLSWRENISHIPQHIYLSDSTIRENIAFGVELKKINIERVNKIIQVAALSDLISDLPDGIDTKVGENGAKLSGGQRQRVGIARALYRRRDVMVLDEATSALDEATEKKIMEAIYLLDKNITIIMISHRPSTLSGCDRVIDLDDNASIK